MGNLRGAEYLHFFFLKISVFTIKNRLKSAFLPQKRHKTRLFWSKQRLK